GLHLIASLVVRHGVIDVDMVGFGVGQVLIAIDPQRSGGGLDESGAYRPVGGVLYGLGLFRQISLGDQPLDEGLQITEYFNPRATVGVAGHGGSRGGCGGGIDRKSTRLNSSHVKISYAVFCLKKKKSATT